MSIEAANNDMIGYDQWERQTYWDALVRAKFIPKNITTACEADCSAGVMSNIRGVGYRLGLKELQNVPITTTNHMRSELKKVGFEVLTDKKYLTSDDYLLPGDILLNDKSHTAVNVSVGRFAVDVSAIEAFVTRLYKIVLKRTPDKSGFRNWVNSIVNKKASASDVAYGFFFSSEFINQNTSDSEYINRLYSALFNRTPDAPGKEHWVNCLKTKNRQYVFNGFINSQEWLNLLKSYNL
jgi:hypothetical protein